MARWTQHVGLSPRVQDFLESNDCKELCSYKMTEGMFGESIMGWVYEHLTENQDAETYMEVVQTEIWSSGPCIFTCLKNLKTGEMIGLWTEKEVNAA